MSVCVCACACVCVCNQCRSCCLASCDLNCMKLVIAIVVFCLWCLNVDVADISISAHMQMSASAFMLEVDVYKDFMIIFLLIFQN